jgi:membrane protease YdiL (CAAX protease family)
MIAASILIFRAAGRAGVAALFRRMVDISRTRSPAWYLAVFLLGPAIVGTQYVLALSSGSPVPDPRWTLLVPVSYAGLFLLTPAEELGWTGYVLDTALARWSALQAGLLTGAVWAAAHAPVWLFAGQSIEWCLWQMLFVIAIRVLMTWVYVNIGRSLFAMDLLHPGFFVWWYLWPVDGTGLSVPSFYDPRNLAITAIAMAAVVTFLWGSKTLSTLRFARGQPLATASLGGGRP